MSGLEAKGCIPHSPAALSTVHRSLLFLLVLSLLHLPPTPGLPMAFSPSTHWVASMLWVLDFTSLQMLPCLQDMNSTAVDEKQINKQNPTRTGFKKKNPSTLISAQKSLYVINAAHIKNLVNITSPLCALGVCGFLYELEHKRNVTCGVTGAIISENGFYCLLEKQIVI